MSESIILTVTGMKCGGCEANVNRLLMAVTGVTTVKADHKQNQVAVEFDADQTTVDALQAAITAAGYTVE